MKSDVHLNYPWVVSSGTFMQSLGARGAGRFSDLGPCSGVHLPAASGLPSGRTFDISPGARRESG